MSEATTHGRNTLRMNRFTVTQRLVAKLTQGEAVIGGIGNSNFDLWCSGQRPEAVRAARASRRFLP